MNNSKKVQKIKCFLILKCKVSLTYRLDGVIVNVQKKTILILYLFIIKGDASESWHFFGTETGK